MSSSKGMQPLEVEDDGPRGATGAAGGAGAMGTRDEPSRDLRTEDPEEYEDEVALFAKHDEASGWGEGGAGRGVMSKRRQVGAALLLLLLALVVVAVVLGIYYGATSSAVERLELEACVPTAVPIPSVADMSLEEKVGQMMQINHKALLSTADVANYFIGSVLSGGGGAPDWGNTAQDWADLVDDLQAKTARTRLKIPIVYGADAVHGHNNVYGATIFPHHSALGASRDQGLVEHIAGAAALEVIGTGVRWSFSPAVSVCRDQRWGRCYESFGEIPDIVETLAFSEIAGWQNAPVNATRAPEVFIAATAKHYVGDGGTKGGKDRGDTECSETELRDVHLRPYAMAIGAGVATIMISYSSWNGLKMHGNKYLITDVLRTELAFEGVIISDWEAIQELPGNFSDQIEASVNAGIDVVMVPGDYKGFQAALIELVKADRVPMSRIDQAVQRVLDLKKVLGLFDNACAPREYLSYVGAPEHRQLARAAVRHSLVLLKNVRRADPSRNMFPLEVEGKKILVVGRHANDIGLQCGGWTIKWQGQQGNITVGTTILEGIQEVVGAKGEVAYQESYDGQETADYAVVVVGEDPYAEWYGDSQTLRLNDTEEQLILSVCTKMPCVLVIVAGRTVDIARFAPEVDALVMAWLPGSEGGGVADVLFGDSDFSGRLPFTWFSTIGQLPLNFNSFPYEYLFAFGFGLDKNNNMVYSGGMP